MTSQLPHDPHYPYNQHYPQQPQQAWPPAPPAPVQKKHRKWPWIVGVLVVLFVIGSVANHGSTGAAGGSSPQYSTPPSIEMWTPPQVPKANAAPAAPAAAAAFGPGVYEVGKGDGQIPPGKYKSSGPDGSNAAGCYYARLRNNDGSLGDILGNNITPGPSVFTVKPTDGYVEINGCTWTRQ